MSSLKHHILVGPLDPPHVISLLYMWFMILFESYDLRTNSHVSYTVLLAFAQTNELKYLLSSFLVL